MLKYQATILVLTLLLTACGMRSQETTFYILDSGQNTPIALDGIKNLEEMPSLQLSQVDMPKYLDRNSIITRDSNGVRLHIASFDSWAEPVESGAKRVIAEILTPLLLEKNVLLQPLDDNSLSPLQIFIQVQRFDGTIGQQVALDARWTVRDSSDEIIVSGAFVEQAPAGQNYTSLVQAHSTLLKKLAQSMANPITEALSKK